jgi:hypothetical protein
MSPCQRSLAKLRAEGWTCGITEHFNPHVKIRQDLFGFCDILAFQGDFIMAVQTTSGPNFAARKEKILANPIAKLWASGGMRMIVIHGWAKRGERGKRKIWTCRDEIVTWPITENET